MGVGEREKLILGRGGGERARAKERERRNNKSRHDIICLNDVFLKEVIA